ncbi:MAG: hypothetical protein ACFFD4_28795 [Candidatus Odinarchaeota archaeon]
MKINDAEGCIPWIISICFNTGKAVRCQSENRNRVLYKYASSEIESERTVKKLLRSNHIHKFMNDFSSDIDKIENFALFVHGNDCKWYFGKLTKPFIETTASFLSGLDSMGQELFGEGVATIKLAGRPYTTIRVSEVFIVSLLGSFFFIMSDPEVTIKLIDAQGGIPFEVGEVMRGVLVGQASILYAEMFSRAEMDEEFRQIDKLFQRVLIKVGITTGLDKFVENGRCSFSPLSLTELLFFHYYIRQEFEKEPSMSRDCWALLTSSSGSNITFDYLVEENITILAGYLSAVHVFITELFKSNPRAIVFGGGDKLTSLTIFNGRDNFLSLANPDEILKQVNFIEKLNDSVPIDVMNDIMPELKLFLAEKTANRIQKKLYTCKLTELYHRYISE